MVNFTEETQLDKTKTPLFGGELQDCLKIRIGIPDNHIRRTESRRQVQSHDDDTFIQNILEHHKHF